MENSIRLQLFLGSLEITKRQENNLGEADKAQWEIHFLSFVLKEGEIRHEWAQTDENGQIFVYPHLDLFDETIYKYLITRLDATNQPKLKARYAHILWCSPKKHKKFAKIAIDSYSKLISTYEQGYDKDGHFLDNENFRSRPQRLLDCSSD